MNLLMRADQAIRKQYPKLNSFLVASQGSLLIEQYYNGHHQHSLHDLRSATKSFMSVLLGIADYQRLLPDLDTPVWEHVKQFAPKRPDPLWETITLRHLLTMTSGLYWETGRKLGEKYIHRFHRSRKWSNFILRLPVVPNMMGTFQYRSVDTHLLSVLLTLWTGRTAADYAKSNLFVPLGISEFQWDGSPEGHSCGHIGLHMTSRGMLSFGELCLQGGVREQHRILSSHWLTLSHTPHTPGYDNYGGYGFQWWVSQIDGVKFAYANGHGGQQIYIIPSLEAVVVFTADSKVNRYKNPRQILAKYVIPALQNGQE